MYIHDCCPKWVYTRNNSSPEITKILSMGFLELVLNNRHMVRNPLESVQNPWSQGR